ncbi:MAG: Xaa-Pro peptidase family protein [Paracoccaceae bacterium]|nr:Xaa-Pro peptidase family protein [Paracoccaceae bacterium]
MTDGVVDQPSRGFEMAEFMRRCVAAQDVMAVHGLGAILLASKADIQYFTGFMTQFWQSPTRPWFVILPTVGAPVAVVPTIGVPLMQACYVSDVRSWASPAAADDGISLLLDTLRQHLDTSERLGLLMGRETALRMPLTDIYTLSSELGDVEMFDVTAQLQQIRMIKSPAEIAKLRHICGCVSAVFEGVPDWVAVGMPLSEVFRHFKIKALHAGVDDVSYLVGSAGQGGYRDIIAPPTDRALRNRDVLMLDTGSVWDGYFSDFDRNFAIGSASDPAHMAHHCLYDATEAALAVVRPGIKAKDLYAAMDTVLRPDAGSAGDLGADDVGRYGHGLGIQLTEPPSHTNWDETVIQAGMALTLEPSILYGDGYLMVAEENILVTETGAEVLSRRCGRDLPIV